MPQGIEEYVALTNVRYVLEQRQREIAGLINEINQDLAINAAVDRENANPRGGGTRNLSPDASNHDRQKIARLRAENAELSRANNILSERIQSPVYENVRSYLDFQVRFLHKTPESSDGPIQSTIGPLDFAANALAVALRGGGALAAAGSVLDDVATEASGLPANPLSLALGINTKFAGLKTLDVDIKAANSISADTIRDLNRGFGGSFEQLLPGALTSELKRRI